MTPWHMAHLGGIFTRGPGCSIIEATAVLPEVYSFTPIQLTPANQQRAVSPPKMSVSGKTSKSRQ